MEVNKFLERVRTDFPNLIFRQGKKFAFRPPRTVVLGVFAGVETEQKIYTMRLLHELGHAVSGHKNFNTDLVRLKMEREAWEKARELADFYGLEFDDEIAEMELDSYREWLHQRSKCPKCGLTRYQTKDGKYHCPLDD